MFHKLTLMYRMLKSGYYKLLRFFTLCSVICVIKENSVITQSGDIIGMLLQMAALVFNWPLI